METKYKVAYHIAYNYATGEVLTCLRSNHLKRRVKWSTSYDRKYLPNVKHEWYFGRSYQAIRERLIAKGKL